MLTSSVILLLILSIGRDVNCGFRMFKYSRSVDTTQFAQSPCPSVFQYQNDENGNLVGALQVDHTDSDGRVQLDIELSVGNGVQGYNGKIVLAEERQKVVNDIMNGRPIRYRVLFPVWLNFPPKITKIVVNGDLICSGPRIPLQMVPILTTINLQHKLSLGVTPLSSSPDSGTDSATFNNFFSSQGTDNTEYPFDVRVDNYPTIPNNIYNFNPKTPRPQSSSNPFLNVNNPYNFNPVGTPPPGFPSLSPSQGSSGDRPSSPPSKSSGNQPPKRGQINPQNPFLNGLSTPQPDRGDIDISINGNNPFFNPRTESSTNIIDSTTRTPPKDAEVDTAIRGSVNEVCGRPLATNSLIVNGHTVPRGAYPWLVAIFRQLENLSLSYICSGSLISERHIVTAAHCVKLEHRRVKPTEIVCVFGKLNIRKWVTSPGERMLEPDSIIIHPDYETGKANADIAVMTFSDPIQFSKMIMPVCLWQGSTDLNQVVGNVGTVVGWGRDENGDVSTAEPRQVNMPIVDQLECLKGSSSIAGQALVEIVSKNTFCAGFRNGSGPCNGDSGSAFLLRKNGIFYLRGIVSTALSEATHRSCNLQEYVVFTDASKYLNWLMSILRQG